MANEKRLISLDEALKATHSEIYWTESQQAAVRSFLVKRPKVDAVEVVHGRWVQMEFWTGGGTWRCSECGRQIMFMKGTPTTEKMHYCPNCGADMRGTEE